jgi:hypothetical protein
MAEKLKSNQGEQARELWVDKGREALAAAHPTKLQTP